MGSPLMNATQDTLSTLPKPWSGFSPAAVAAAMESLDLPAYRVRQLIRSLNHVGVWDWSDVSEFSKDLRTSLGSMAPLRSLRVELNLVSERDGTNKVLFATADGGRVESVLMRSGGEQARRFTVCVSSQIGCPAACTFCASGLGGFARNLTTAEIVDQVHFFAGRLRRDGHRLDNVVYMGMGEPFLNYSRVMESIARLRDPEGLGLGARRITVSTVGIVPAINRFSEDAGEVNLAVSLHAPNDPLRTKLVPYNQHFPIAAIMEAVRKYVARSSRRVSFEYVLLRDVNDAPALATELAALLKPLKSLAHVNLIPWNPFGEAGLSRVTRDTADAFAARLQKLGVNTTIRHSKGLDINAACGQLRRRAVEGSSAS